MAVCTWISKPSQIDLIIKKYEIVTLMNFAGDFLPPQNEYIYDIESDETISHIAFYGIGQVYLEAGSEEHAYEIDLSSMYNLERREGYDKLGAKAIFDSDRRLIKIKTQKGRIYFRCYPINTPLIQNDGNDLWGYEYHI